MNAILRGAAVLAILLPPVALSDPILSVDFNAGSGAPTPTQPGWKAFAPVSTANQTGPISTAYSGLDAALTSGTVTVTVASGTSVSATGTLTSRDRIRMEHPSFPLYYLYRDFVTASGPITVGLSGLKPGKAYQLSLTAYDDSNSRSMKFTDYTAGTAGATATLAWTAAAAFDAETDLGLCTRTLGVTADASGNAVVRVASTDANAGAVLGALSLSEPAATWHLVVNQVDSNDWTPTYLSHWNSSAGGGGTAPASINVADTYVNDQETNQLRAPSFTSTFAGGLLILGGTAHLTLKTGSTATSTIPRFLSEGGSIDQGVASIVQHLSVGDYEVGGTTGLTAGSGRSIALAVATLHGGGDLSLSGSGTFLFSFVDASAYEGTIRVASGATLSVQSLLATQGGLTLATGCHVVLNQYVYVTSCTVGGTALAAGIYSYAALHASYPAVFASGSASGAVVVYAVDAAGPVRMGGVNLSCAEWGPLPGVYGTNYIYPTAAEFDYYHGKGLNLVRLPFRWERLQPTLNADLDADELARIDAVVGYAHARGMKVILDMHNYGTYNGTLIGASGVPVSAFRDAWRRIADHFKGETAIYGYDLMNEPHNASANWPASAQQAVLGLREVDGAHYAIVEGEAWAGAATWETANAGLHILDPVGRLIYEAHNYFVSDLSETYDEASASPALGVDRARPFVHWLEFHQAQGYVGECGVPYDDNRWLAVLDAFYAYAVAAGLSTTYWAGGPSWSSTDALTCEPVGGVERPQMSVIEDYP